MGIRSAVFFAAMTPAISATARTSPFRPSPDIARARVAGDMRRNPSATASRAVEALSETSTIRARPASSRWVSLLTFRAALLFQESGHELDHVAGAVAAVELGGDHLVPTVLHRPVRARQAEDEHAPDDAGGGARLQRGEPHRLVADQVEDHRKAVDLLV